MPFSGCSKLSSYNRTSAVRFAFSSSSSTDVRCMPSKVSIYQYESTESELVAAAQPEAPTRQAQAAVATMIFAVFFIYFTKF